MKTVILAAGVGKRFRALHLPKSLTLLQNGQTLLGRQLELISQFTSLNDVIIVVGYRKERIMEQFPNQLYVFNPEFADENTAKSLLRALHKIHDEDVLWLNADVVFRPKVLQAILEANRTSMIVNVDHVDDEGVKYQATPEGRILAVSKTLQHPQGEALGINLVKANDLKLLIDCLERCDANDYFEKGIEHCIAAGMKVWAVPVGAEDCTEVDFPEDLKKANAIV